MRLGSADHESFEGMRVRREVFGCSLAGDKDVIITVSSAFG